jgi:alpha-methylacyl-CoA racemase
MMLAFGIVCALFERAASGRGQVIDAAMVDGAASLMTFFHGVEQSGWWKAGRGSNLLDTGAHFYDTYETADGKFVALGAIEPKFYAELTRRMGLDPEKLPAQMDRSHWNAQKEDFARLIKTKTRDEWCQAMEGSDACLTPVLSLEEARQHPHNRARDTFVTVAGTPQPGPAPRFSRTPGKLAGPPPHAGQHTDEALVDWGISAKDVARLRESGAIA